ncbi:MAG: hypothetical protein BWX92_03999 [Deltaproteobacteria bacterium ADurb.Bin135]|jgi:hypothetical protein|nr:MAG: hypothetical protein BWX92_03999 [Deltaproteobacteria bacterium ADurb.Bin135]
MRGKSVYLLGEILRLVGEKKNSLDNPCGDVWLNLKKSAEVIVLTETVRKDRTVTNFSSEGRWGNA